MKANGGNYSREPDWHSHVVTDGLLVIAQNPASPEATVQALLKLLG